MKKYKPNSRKGRRNKTWYLLVLIVGLIVILFFPRLTIAEPHHTERAGVYWIYSEVSEEVQIKKYIAEKFPEHPQTALAVFTGESQLNTCAFGDSNNRNAPEGSWGIAQINKAVHKKLIGDRDLCNWKDNIDIAREVYDEAGGFTPWTVFNTGAYKKYK